MVDDLRNFVLDMTIIPTGLLCRGGRLAVVVLATVAALLSNSDAWAEKLDGPANNIKGVVRMWSVLHELGNVCAGFPDESGRLTQLDIMGRDRYGFSAVAYAGELARNPEWQRIIRKDLSFIVGEASDCDTPRLADWQADARQYLDIAVQALGNPRGDLVTTWPAPALLTPVRFSVEGGGHDGEGRGYLNLSIGNTTSQPIGVALSGRRLMVGFCDLLSSAEIPIAADSYRPSALLTLARGETVRVRLRLDESCVESDPTALLGTLIIQTAEGMAYRGIVLLDVPAI